MYQKLVRSTDSPTGRWLVLAILLEEVQRMRIQGFRCSDEILNLPSPGLLR